MQRPGVSGDVVSARRMSDNERMDAWVTKWLQEKYGSAAGASVQSFGALPLSGEVAVWHPLDDLYEAPRFDLGSGAGVEAVNHAKELAGYVLRAKPSRDVVRWAPIGDASTDADRFFLVEMAQAKAVVAWLNEAPLDFEQLGGEQPVQTVTHPNGTRVVVVLSHDGNAHLLGGYGADGTLVCVRFDA